MHVRFTLHASMHLRQVKGGGVQVQNVKGGLEGHASSNSSATNSKPTSVGQQPTQQGQFIPRSMFLGEIPKLGKEIKETLHNCSFSSLTWICSVCQNGPLLLNL